MSDRRPIVPALPLGRAAPWVLGAVAAVLLLLGLWRGNGELALLGVVGLAGVVVAFPLSSLLLGRRPHDDP